MTGWLIAALGAFGAVIAAWLRGQARGRADAKARQDADYRDTRRRMDDAGNDADGASDDDVRRRLRDHAER